MRLGLFLTSLLFASSTAFTINNGRVGYTGVPLRMSANVEAEVPLIVTGNNIDLTEALNEYIDKRIGNPLRKLSTAGFVQECDVHLSVSKNPKVKNGHRVDLTAILKGLTIHCKEETPDMYTTIDSIAHALNRKLLKYKERRQQGYHAGNAMGEDFLDTIDALEAEFELLNGNTADQFEGKEEEFIDPEAPSITKVKSYDLDSPISMKEAIFALDYVDHDFFVFRNEETDKVNIVYKRNAGGVGQIEV